MPIGAWTTDVAMTAEHPPTTGLGWCFLDFGAINRTLFPRAENVSATLGGVPMGYYLDYFCDDTPHRKERGGAWTFVNVSGFAPSNHGLAEIAPNESFAFYSEILGAARERFGLELLFADFLECRQGANCGGAHAFGADCGRAWLDGMARAAEAQRVETQFCMATANQLVQSAAWPAVTNARASGDGGAVDAYVFASVLAAGLGLGWSTDNIRLSFAGCTDPPCDTSFGSQKLVAALALLSLGPVGLADQLSASIRNASARHDATSDVALAKSLAAADGTLLQPSAPLTPLDATLLQRDGLGFSDTKAGWIAGNASAWATYTSVEREGAAGGDGETNGTLVWFTLLLFQHAGGSHDPVKPPFTFELGPEHLAGAIDAADARVPTTVDEVPTAGFLGAGDDELPGTSYAWWDPDANATGAGVGGAPCDGPGGAVGLFDAAHRVNVTVEGPPFAEKGTAST